MKKTTLFSCALWAAMTLVSSGAYAQAKVAMTTAKAAGETFSFVTNLKKVSVDWGDGKPVEVTAEQGIVSGKLKGNKVNITAEHLTFLDCSKNEITEMTLSDVLDLQTLYCSDNQLKELNLNSCRYLLNLDCAQNELANLSLTLQNNLKYLDCSGNKLNSLSLSYQKKLETLICSDNQLSYLNVGSQTSLKTLWCENNSLETLNLGSNAQLESVACYGNKLTSVSVAAAPEMVDFWCDDNKLESLDLGHSAKMETFSCSNNQLSQLKLAALADRHKALAFYCNGNSLTYSSFYSPENVVNKSEFLYDNQGAFALPKKSVKVGEALNVENVDKNADGDNVSPRFVWKDGDKELEKGSKADYTARNTIFIFNKPFTGIRCEVSSYDYPDLTLVSEPLDVVDPTGITDVMEDYGFKYITNNGAITMSSDKPYRVTIHSVDGKQVWTGLVTSSDCRVTLGHGIFLVNGIKISL